MPRIPLLGGAYRQASLIAGAQRSFNLYPEHNAEHAQAPANVTHYSRPGLTAVGAGSPVVGIGRMLVASSLGDLYAVVNNVVYEIDANLVWTSLGPLTTNLNTPVSFTDNGVTGFLVDTSRTGSQINLANNALSAISDPNFLGATRNDFLDGFAIFNEPGTPNWYCTTLYSNVFNALFFGTKTAWPDNIISLIASERQAWLLGRYRSEVWQNAGTIPFPFQIISGSIVEHGIVGPFAVGKGDVNIYWLSQNPEGARMAMRGASIQAQRISTHAIEEEWLGYTTVNDCIVTTYQIRGHLFICFDFPTADRTWVFDEATHEWHEVGWIDSNGVQHRWQALFKAYAYGMNLALDWSTGALYKIDETNYTDNGWPLSYRRGMPHLVDNQHFSRITCWKIIADMECGTTTIVPGNPPPQVELRISRDRGFTFTTHSLQPLSTPVTGPTFPEGYVVKPTWNRCGMAYDMVPELIWTGPIKSALQGVFAEIEEHPGDE
jgi:hypothetical protein